jgi:hypothetical protein
MDSEAAHATASFNRAELAALSQAHNLPYLYVTPVEQAHLARGGGAERVYFSAVPHPRGHSAGSGRKTLPRLARSLLARTTLDQSCARR